MPPGLSRDDMSPVQTDAKAARAVEIFGAILASGGADPYPLCAQLHELGDAAAPGPGLVVPGPARWREPARCEHPGRRSWMLAGPKSVSA
jgi:hypothetical protein